MIYVKKIIFTLYYQSSSQFQWARTCLSQSRAGTSAQFSCNTTSAPVWACLFWPPADYPSFQVLEMQKRNILFLLSGHVMVSNMDFERNHAQNMDVFQLQHILSILSYALILF